MRTEPEPVTSPPSAGAVRREVERILASRVFAASGRMSRFLRFAVEKALDGRGGELKEYAVAEWRWDEAERHFRRAIALNPGYVTARHWYACDCLAPLGQVDVAIDMMQTAIDLDPLSHVLRESRAYLLLLARRYDECIEACAAIAELDPHFYKAYSNMARAHVHKGMFAEGVALFEKARQLIGDIPPLIGALGQAQGLAGNRDEAARLLAKLIDMSKQRHVPASAFAMIHIGLGDYDSALDVLEEGVARRQASLAALNVHPGYDALRGNPRFERLLEQIGFRPKVR